MIKEKKKNWYTNPKKYHYIYKTTCLVNGKYYYGLHSTDKLDDNYIGSGTYLWHSIKKYGRENFKLEILEFCSDRESLKNRESKLITKEMLKDPTCMNLSLGGSGAEHTSSSKQTISKKLTGRIISEDVRKQMSISAKERMQRMKDSGEWEKIKNKNSLAHIGKIQTQETIIKKINSIKKNREINGRKKFSDQARANISKSLIGASRNKKKWFLIDKKTGEKKMIENLQKWLRDNECSTSLLNTIIKDRDKNVIYSIEREIK